MAEFFQLSQADQREALEVAAARFGLPPHLLEKDIWVVWALQHLFSGPYAEHLVFKGGTSLSKAYGIIQRFSEDVDLTYDIRAIAGDLTGDADQPLPANRSQLKKWNSEIQDRLWTWTADEIAPRFLAAIDQQTLLATVRAERDKVFIDYRPLSRGSGYSAASIQLEFGARSTGEPSVARLVVCDAAAFLPGVEFPTAQPQVMRPERTFWEKATAIHVFCAQGEFRGGERFSRHWHDLGRLDAAGIADAAIKDRPLAQAVADHKRVFFQEKTPAQEIIDYHAAVNGELQLVPGTRGLAKLADDYRRMADDGLLREEPESFDSLMEHCLGIQGKANLRLT